MLRAAALAPPLPTPSTEHSDDESYSSIDSISTDNSDELVKIADPVELEVRVLAKSMCLERHAEKRHRADAEFEDVMNEVRLEQGLWQDAEHTARAREWDDPAAFAFSDNE